MVEKTFRIGTFFCVELYISYLHGLINNCHKSHDCRDKPTRHHLKNVYSALSLAMLSAGVGAVAFFFTGFMVGSLLGNYFWPAMHQGVLSRDGRSKVIKTLALSTSYYFTE